MFSGQFYEKRLSVRERNIKFLLETATYMAMKKKSYLHIYNRNSHVRNALQKITATEAPICIITIKIFNHIFAAETVTCICAAENSTCIVATKTVTCITATERSTNLPVTDSTTSKPT